MNVREMNRSWLLGFLPRQRLEKVVFSFSGLQFIGFENVISALGDNHQLTEVHMKNGDDLCLCKAQLIHMAPQVK